MKSHVSLYRRRFRVRAYELGADGRVRDSVYLNYLHQAAFEASAYVGYDLDRYNELGTIWVIRDQRIVYLEPLHGGDEVEVKTWVSDLRRVCSHREYELRRVGDGATVALAQADWVYLDRARLFPRRIPAQARQDFDANGVSALEAAPPLEAAQEIDRGPFFYRHRALWHEQDDLGHVNNANYLNWLNQARRQALADMGHSPDDWQLVPLQYEIEYLRPVLEGDQVGITSRVVAAGQTQFAWQHEISRDGERLVNAKATLKSCSEKPMRVLLG